MQYTIFDFAENIENTQCIEDKEYGFKRTSLFIVKQAGRCEVENPDKYEIQCQNCPFNKENNGLGKTCEELGVQRIKLLEEDYKTTECNENTLHHMINFTHSKTYFQNGKLVIANELRVPFEEMHAYEQLEILSSKACKEFRENKRMTQWISSELIEDMEGMKLSLEEKELVELLTVKFIPTERPKSLVEFFEKLYDHCFATPEISHEGNEGENRIEYSHNSFFVLRRFLKNINIPDIHGLDTYNKAIIELHNKPKVCMFDMFNILIEKVSKLEPELLYFWSPLRLLINQERIVKKDKVKKCKMRRHNHRKGG
jgi:hypothetical protein